MSVFLFLSSEPAESGVTLAATFGRRLQKLFCDSYIPSPPLNFSIHTYT